MDVTPLPEQPAGPLQRLDLEASRRWAVIMRSLLAVRRDELDALNVFPVPDGDTGTNLYLTVDSALDAVRDERRSAFIDGAAADAPAAGGLPEVCAALTRATLLSARGNSGVIFSQLVNGFAQALAEADEPQRGSIGATTLTRAIRRANDVAWRSVVHPVEGTILSVSAAAAEVAEEALAAGGDLYAVVVAALEGARAALDRTTAQLPALERAGVVDAGGAGYLLLLESLELVVSGTHPDDVWWSAQRTRRRAVRAVRGKQAQEVKAQEATEAQGPAYEVMYLLSDSTDGAVAELREALDSLGDSLLVVGGPDVWNVHVHVDDAAAAVEAGVRAGRPYRIAITRFEDLHADRSGNGEQPGVATRRVAVVACAAGKGLSELFTESGADVVPSGPGRRASTGQLLDAARATGAATVLLLPNDDDTQLAADAAARAARDEGLDIQVVRSHAAVQGVAALAVFDPERSVADNLVAMSSAAAATRQGAVTVASREALTSAGRCRAGDVLGLVDGDIVSIGDDLQTIGAGVVQRLLGSGGELVTIVVGEAAPEGLGHAIAESARLGRREVEASIIQGGQPVYALLLGVE